MINPKNLAVVLKFLNPDADFIVRDDSDGSDPYIEAWNSVDTQPTQAEIDTAGTSGNGSIKNRSIEAIHRRIRLTLWVRHFRPTNRRAKR